MKTPTFALLLTLGLLAAGCIAPPDGQSPGGARAPNAGGSMTAKETREDAVALCTDGLALGVGRFCATRTVRVEGDLSGLGHMEVDLATFNGNVDLADHEEGGWSLVATLRARGATEADAKANLEKIRFTWSHESGGTHFVAAKAESPRETDGGYAASLAAALPRSVVLVVTAATSNGNVAVKNVATDGLSAQTSNGAVEVDATVTQVDLRTSNGRIGGKLVPTGSGRVSAATSNGAIELAFPEDARHGYDLDAQTSNGKVTVNLRDGETTRKGPSNPYYDPQNDARFTTHGYASRAIQSSVTLTTSNGAITVNAT